MAGCTSSARGSSRALSSSRCWTKPLAPSSRCRMPTSATFSSTTRKARPSRSSLTTASRRIPRLLQPRARGQRRLWPGLRQAGAGHHRGCRDRSGFAPHRQIAASAGFRAVQSTPLFEPHRRTARHDLDPLPPTPSSLGARATMTDLYARQAAEIIERKRAEEALRQSEAGSACWPRPSRTRCGAACPTARWTIATGAGWTIPASLRRTSGEMGGRRTFIPTTWGPSSRRGRRPAPTAIRTKPNSACAESMAGIVAFCRGRSRSRTSRATSFGGSAPIRISKGGSRPKRPCATRRPTSRTSRG